MKRYKFFAHFNRVNMQRGNPNVWTVHYRNTCYQAKEVEFRTPVYTRYRPEGQQPRATLRGQAYGIAFEGDKLIVT